MAHARTLVIALILAVACTATSSAAAKPVPLSPAVVIARVLAVPCLDTQMIPTPDNLHMVDEATLCLIDQARAQVNELPLKMNARLELAARGHSESMVAEDYFAHVTPAGETPAQRFKAAGYIDSTRVGYVVGENIAWGTLSLATPQAMVNAWMASPEHRANILESRYRGTAIGVALGVPALVSGGAPGATYTEDFGVIYG
jgi:uncharacterized protein YkwD